MPIVRCNLLVSWLALSCWCAQAIAGDNPITSCDEAPQLADVRAQFPRHILASEATSPPKIKRHSDFSPHRLLRDVGSPVCIVMVVDSSGKVVDAKVVYPSSVLLTRQERKAIMSVRMTPAEVDGAPQSSLSIMSLTGH